MEDEARIHVDSGASDDSVWAGADVASRRVVRQPSRRTRAAAVVVLAGLVFGGLVLSLAGSGADDDRPDAPAPQPESPNDAYVTAVARLGRARSFAFSGEPARLPAGWALTDGGVSITEPGVRCGTGGGSGGCDLPEGGCAGSRGWAESCGPSTRAECSTGFAFAKMR